MRLLLMFCLLSFGSVELFAKAIDIYIRDDVYKDYRTFVDNRDITTINDFTGVTIRRDVVDMVIAQQALQLGGFKHRFNYIPGKVNFHNTRMLENGKLLMSFDTYWLADANTMQDYLFISAPIIRDGEYIAGIYTRASNAKLYNLTTIEDFRRLTAVSTPKWRTDWKTLAQLPLKKLIREDEWISMARMVNKGWVDFMLMPFHSTSDQSFQLDDIDLAPVPNVAVKLSDSRHFVISRKHPYGAEAYKAIKKGIKILRQQNAITKAYTQAGFFVDRSKLTILNEF